MKGYGWVDALAAFPLPRILRYPTTDAGRLIGSLIIVGVGVVGMLTGYLPRPLRRPRDVFARVSRVVRVR